MKAKTDALAQASMKLGEAMYKAQAETEAAAGGSDDGDTGDGDGGSDSSGKADDDVVDADFEEVDDDQKKSA